MIRGTRMLENARRRIVKIGESISMFLALIIISIIIFTFRKYVIRTILGLPVMISIFILSFISCIALLPIPYTYIVFLVAATIQLNPIIASIVSGVGAGLGEAVAWIIGRGSKDVLEDTEYVVRLNTLLRYLEKKASWMMPLIAFLFALTPAPDKLLYLPLGLLGFDLKKVLPFTLLGKILMTYIIITAGSIWGSIIGESIESEFNDIIMFIVTTILLLVIMALFLFIRWDQILLRFVGNRSAENQL